MHWKSLKIDARNETGSTALFELSKDDEHNENYKRKVYEKLLPKNTAEYWERELKNNATQYLTNDHILDRDNVDIKTF
jgi:hypothetical protein